MAELAETAQNDGTGISKCIMPLTGLVESAVVRRKMKVSQDAMRDFPLLPHN